MSILLSALSRYHVFDLAVQLQKHDLMDGIVTAYPKSRLGRYACLQPSVISVARFAVARKAALALDRLIGPARASAIHELVYARFSRAVAAESQRRPAPIVYGLSGYMKEVLESPTARSRVTVVDHGSLHIETEKRILSEECDRFGFTAFGNWQYDWLVRRMGEEFQRADHVVCCSELARETMIEHGVDENKLVVHRLGVNLVDFTRQPGRQRGDGRGLRLLFVGAMTPLKGLHYLLSAFTKLPGDTELWLVGALPTDQVLMKMIDDCMRETGRVKLIGPVPQVELNKIYNQCDLFVLPSLSDGWGMVVSQALACGLPAVVSDMTGAKEMIKPGLNGQIVKSRDLADLTEKLEWSIELCKSGNWRGGLDESISSIRENSWDDYGKGWEKWARQIGA
jgi:glycosyltransferase involved in cell wall biosynthesis